MPELQTILTYRAWRTNDGEGNPLACACGMRGPKPYDEGDVFFTVARGPVPRDRCMARDRPSPYVKRRRFFHRSAGACPPRSLHGEGNPLGCACGIRGPSPYDEGGLSAAAAPAGAPPYCIETGRSLLPHRDREVSPTGTSLASRPGGLSYTDL